VDQHAQSTGRKEAPGWVQIAGGLSAVAVIGSAMYVMLQAFYVEFYDDFGVRPEQVGLDRAAVLSRAASIALAALILFAVGAVALNYLTQLQQDPALKKALAIAAVVAILAVVAGYFWVRGTVVEGEARKVTLGQTVEGFGPLNLVDVRAYPARVKWIGDPDARPNILDENEMMFLGLGAAGAVFYTEECTTIVVPTAAVEIQLLSQGPIPPTDAQLGWNPDSCR
jgi:cytochrome bd-type quinol oxidase subunit 2